MMSTSVRVAVLLLLTAFSVSACNKPSNVSNAHNQSQPNPATPNETQKVEVKTEPISKRVLGASMHIHGQIRPEPHKEAEVSPRFEGRVLELNVKVGDEVQPGTILCLIDSHEISSLQAELIEAKSKLRIAEAHEEREKQVYNENVQRPKALIEAKTRYEQSKVHLGQAESEFKRVEGLHKEKIAAERDYVAAQATLEKARLDTNEAHSQMLREESLYNNKALIKRELQLAEAETLRELQHLNTLKQRLELDGLTDDVIKKILDSGKIVLSLPIRARVSGVITHVDISVGERTTPGKHAFVITDLSTLNVVAGLPEVDLSGIKVGSMLKVKVPSYPDEFFTAKVSSISDTVDPATRTVSVTGSLDNKSRKLKVNMSAEVYLEAPPRAVLAVPKSAVREHNGKKFVIVKEGGQYREHHVDLGADTEEYYEVAAGLKEGDEVVTQGSLDLHTELR